MYKVLANNAYLQRNLTFFQTKTINLCILRAVTQRKNHTIFGINSNYYKLDHSSKFFTNSNTLRTDWKNLESQKFERFVKNRIVQFQYEIFKSLSNF